MAKSEQRSAPAGTGYQPGLGEAFALNLSTGQGTYSYQIPLPDGVAQHTPRLRLEYLHGVGHGPWGLGWRLPLRSLTRRLDTGNEVLRLLDSGNELVPLADGSWGALQETAFSRYRPEGDGWRIEERNGTVHLLGLTPATRLAPPDQPQRPLEWLLERTLDVHGNAIDYHYRMEAGFAYLDSVRYGAWEVRLSYEARPDVRHDGRGGFSRRRTLRCILLQLILDPGEQERPIRSYRFEYQLAPVSAVSLLTAVGFTAHGAAADGSQDVVRPTARFRYTPFDPRQVRVSWMQAEAGQPPALTEPDAALVTLDNAPLPGVLLNRDGREIYWANRGDGRWAAPRPVARAPLAGSFRRSGLALVDMDGSGAADLMVANPDALQGYYLNEGRQGWGDFVPFPPGERPTPPWSDANLRLLDADGDGRPDALVSQRRALALWRNRGSQGWAAPVLLPKTADGLPDLDFADPDLHFADMSGDGNLDIVRVRSGRVEYWPGLGDGRFGARIVMGNSPRLRRDPLRDTLLLSDLDGDGCAELIEVTAEGLRLYPNQNGQRFGDVVAIGGLPTPLRGTLHALNLSGGAGAGLMWNSPVRGGIGYVQFSFAASQPPWLLAQIENGAGLRSEIRYRSAIEDYQRDRDAGELWQTHFPFPYLVVASTRETDAVSGRETVVELRYHEAHFERRARRFEGFRRTERLERGDASRPDTLQVHHFLMAQERQPGNGPQHALLNGLLQRMALFQMDGSPQQPLPLREEFSDYGLTALEGSSDGRARSFLFLSEFRVEESERGADLRVERKQYQYDGFGNVTQERLEASGQQGGTALPARVRTLETTYATSTEHYLLDKPARVTLRDGEGHLCSERRYFYDGEPFVGLPAGQAGRGLLSREQSWVMTETEFAAHYAGMDAAALGYTPGEDADGTPGLFATSQRQQHDARGLRLAQRDALGQEIRFSYDAQGLFRTGLTSILGETRFSYDRATGQITRTEYADGAITAFTYDAQGRVLRVARPGEALESAATDYQYDESQIPNRRVARQHPAPGVTALAITYFDGSGKEFQSRTEVEPGTFVVSALQTPNPWGVPSREYEPVFSDSEAFALPPTEGRPCRRFFYDASGRVVRTENYNGGLSSADYQPFRVTLRDANDHDDSPENQARGQFNTPREEQLDVMRSLVAVVERPDAATTLTTHYTLGPLGELAAIADAQGEMARYRYDRCGNRLAIWLRDNGERRIWYDAANRPVRTLDAAGHDLHATWDALGRQTRLAQGDTLLEEYLYDTPAQSAHGRLAEVRYPGGSQSFHYDLAGRLLARDYQHEGEASARRVAYEYDALGRETATGHADGTRITHDYYLNGWLRAVPGIIDSLRYNARGQPEELIGHNGVRTFCEYTAGPGRLSRQRVLSPQGELYDEIVFGFDKMELLVSRQEGENQRYEYGYDGLYQLTQETHTRPEGPLVRHYAYSPLGNLLRADEAALSLRYDDAAHPGRLSALTPDAGAPFDASYDGNGNLLALPGQQFSYNARNELVRMQRQDGLVAEYRYDHLGMRTSKVINDGHGGVARTLYLSEEAEITNGVASYFINLGVRRVAVIHNGALRYLHDDGAGCTRFMTDATGQRLGRVQGRPFGNASVEGDTRFRTFALHAVDEESGLVYMQRRYYSPLLGRFLTPDLMATYQPEKFLHQPQGLHLYTFVANDPLNKSDATGLSFWSFVGAVVGAVVGVIVGVAIVAAVVATGGLAGIALGIGLALGASLLATGISYVIASNVDPSSGFGQFVRGFMIGFNAGMNGVFASALFGPVIGITLGVINFIATFEGASQSPVYQGILGWTSWAMPMSWAGIALGAVFFIINLLAAAVTFQQVDALKIEKLQIDWRSGSIVMVNGLIRNGTAFNVGNFVFMNKEWTDNPASGGFEAVLNHEVGHSLNNAAFGPAFGIYDALNETLLGAGSNDYGEQLAESHTNRPWRPKIPMWG
ncbi:toxin TcdB middle/N-terminal domain-containing protein [Nissabacter sp. SGAir0207]|uniref:toxin TcdB middle/N-terminal domain-containing protein n=1 Tax=Nissabacter sp. SGAir0207 TaxID=2126321 RepID=UPI0010CCC279|nr:toxin TcdB middle/N-terminal domain-containing protein [Nissabacter sp. SGAir0207]QCR35369.1 hypothetical protein C1N62_04330 [Nissabacter sp. SGAir0207]